MKKIKPLEAMFVILIFVAGIKILAVLYQWTMDYFSLLSQVIK